MPLEIAWSFGFTWCLGENENGHCRRLHSMGRKIAALFNFWEANLSYGKNSYSLKSKKWHCMYAGLKVDKEKTKVMRISTKDTTPVKRNDMTLADVDKICFLDSIFSKTGGISADVTKRISEAKKSKLFKVVFIVRNIWWRKKWDFSMI